MDDFVNVNNERDQGDNQYYPLTADAFNDKYFGNGTPNSGTLSAEVVAALEDGWDKDLNGNDRFHGTIDVGPIEEQ
jgi:hypothetical protein